MSARFACVFGTYFAANLKILRLPTDDDAPAFRYISVFGQNTLTRGRAFLYRPKLKSNLLFYLPDCPFQTPFRQIEISPYFHSVNARSGKLHAGIRMFQLKDWLTFH